jgi:hypothetical protein
LLGVKSTGLGNDTGHEAETQKAYRRNISKLNIVINNILITGIET